MKKHKMFAWLTVLCFFLTIITGYEKQCFYDNGGFYYEMG